MKCVYGIGCEQLDLTPYTISMYLCFLSPKKMNK